MKNSSIISEEEHKLVIPHISWERMSVDDLKHYYETTTQEYSKEHKELIITLVHLVEEGKIRAFKDPNGEIRYQSDSISPFELIDETET